MDSRRFRNVSEKQAGGRPLRLLLALSGGALLLCGALGLALPPVTNSPRPLAEYGERTLFSAFSGTSPKTLDPQRSYSTDEAVFVASICEPPYQYAYLERPYRLEPRAAEAVSPPAYFDRSGRELPSDADPADIAESRYTIRLKADLRYAPHPAFAKDAEGKPLYFHLDEKTAQQVHSPLDLPERASRAATAADFANGIRRIASPQVVSPIFGTMSHWIIGLDEYGRRMAERWRERTAAGTPPDAYLDLWAEPLPGVVVKDERTLVIRIKGKYPQFAYWLATSFFSPVPVEAEKFYAQPALRANNVSLDTWPVGTGAFQMSVFEENRRHEMTRNPLFREARYPCRGEPGDAQKGLLADCGKPLPFVDRVVFDAEKESVPLQTKFLQGYYDSPYISSVDTGLGYLVAMEDDPEKAALYKEKALQFPRTLQAGLWYLGFNWLDPVIGGGRTPEEARRARLLRQAISIALDWEENIAIFQKNQGMPAQGPIPPGLFGWQDDGPTGFNPIVYDRAPDGRRVRKSLDEAKRLMAEAGYPGGRDAKTGKPLILNFDYQNAAQGSKAYLEWYQRQFAKLGIQLEIRATDYNRFQEKMAKGAEQIFFWGWSADYPDAENFLFLYYGPNGKVKHGGENAGNYESAAYDRAFAAMRYLDDGPQKQKLVDEMVSILQQDAPAAFGYYPPGAAAFQSWVGNVKPSAMVRNTLEYIKVDPQKRLALIQEWNRPVLWPLALMALGAAALLWGAVELRRARLSLRLRPRPKAD